METQWSDTEEVDRPERLDGLWPLDILGWLWSLPGRAIAALHLFCHRWEPPCPLCGTYSALADVWADKCRREEAAHKTTVDRLTVAPGTPVLGGAEEGGVSYPGLRPVFAEPVDRDILVDCYYGRGLEEVIADFRDGPQTVAPEPPTRKSEGRHVIPLDLGGASISAALAAKRGTRHPAHSRPASAWPQRRSSVERTTG